MIERIKSMMIKEFIQILRDPKMRSMILIVPIIQMFIFGYALTTDLRHVAVAVYDLDQTVTSRNVVSAIVNTGYFYVVDYLDRPGQVNDVLNRGEAMVVLHFNQGFEEHIKAGRTAPLQVLIDGTESNTAGIVFSYIGRTIRDFSQKIVIEKFPPFVKRTGIELQSRAWFNPNLESRNFYLPGIVAILITLMTLILTSMAIVREKEVGTMEQILVTPITPLEFILGKTVPFILIGFLNVTIILFVAVFWFGIAIRGSILLLFLGATFYLLTTLGIGLFISTISQTQQQALMSALLFYLPTVLLSGFIYPIANMPNIIQWVTYFNPLKYFLIVIRGIFLKGIGWDILWPQILLLLVMGLLVLGISSRYFRKTLS